MKAAAALRTLVMSRPDRVAVTMRRPPQPAQLTAPVVVAAMGHLAKLLNLLVDRQEIGGPDGGPVEVTDHRGRITERLNDIAKRTAPDNDGSEA